ncbi:hypothetical protein NEUTE2DRAFT_74231, partial [Neurospora tetrasperma FGSC 2509]
FYYLFACLSPVIKKLFVAFTSSLSLRSPTALFNKLWLIYSDSNVTKRIG